MGETEAKLLLIEEGFEEEAFEEAEVGLEPFALALAFEELEEELEEEFEEEELEDVVVEKERGEKVGEIGEVGAESEVEIEDKVKDVGLLIVNEEVMGLLDIDVDVGVNIGVDVDVGVGVVVGGNSSDGRVEGAFEEMTGFAKDKEFAVERVGVGMEENPSRLCKEGLFAIFEEFKGAKSTGLELFDVLFPLACVGVV